MHPPDQCTIIFTDIAPNVQVQYTHLCIGVAVVLRLFTVDNPKDTQNWARGIVPLGQHDDGFSCFYRHKVKSPQGMHSTPPCVLARLIQG